MNQTLIAQYSGLRRLLLNWPGPVGTIAIAQLFGTSLWFSANGAASDLIRSWHASPEDIGWLTNAVQLGFILGTLSISLSGMADRFKASRIFVVSSLIGALLNLLFAWHAEGLLSGTVLRFGVGVTLAGIYPMGMKLIVGWAPERKGLALAQLVAMLTLGTALPHALRLIGSGWAWQEVVTTSSLLALCGALLVGALSEGPHAAPPNSSRPEGKGAHAIRTAFSIRAFRAATLGYFGHMWELYAFWTMVPLIVAKTGLAAEFPSLGVAGLSFLIIAVGAPGSLLGGIGSQKIGSARIAMFALVMSGICMVSFLLFGHELSAGAMLVLLCLWGASVVADSPQFSALAAGACSRESVGSALAIQNSIGFALTLVSIGLTTSLFARSGINALWLLVPGPLAGIFGFISTSRRKP